MANTILLQRQTGKERRAEATGGEAAAGSGLVRWETFQLPWQRRNVDATNWKHVEGKRCAGVGRGTLGHHTLSLSLALSLQTALPANLSKK